MSRADVCVIFNTTAGNGRAAACLRRLRRRLGPAVEIRSTREPGHAAHLAEEAARAGFPLVAAAGGDGTVHETANGLLRANCPDVVLAVLPVGSANDYAHTLGLAPDWWERPDPMVRPAPVDIGVARRSDGHSSYFLNNIGIGLTGAVALEAEAVPFRGLARYMIGLARTLCWRFQHPMMSVTLNDSTRHEPTLALSLGIGRREGNFQLVPDAELDDGLFDYVHATRLSRLGLVTLLPAAIRGALPRHRPDLHIGRCQKASVISEASLVAHMDGEFLCRPNDGVTHLEVSLLPARLRVLRRLG